MQVGCLELQHLVDAIPIDLVGSGANFFGGAVTTAKTGSNDVFAMFVQEIKGLQVRAGRDLDELREAITDLSLWERSKETEVQEGMDWGMISSQPVLVVACASVS